MEPVLIGIKRNFQAFLSVFAYKALNKRFVALCHLISDY